MWTAIDQELDGGSFSHQALFYQGEQDFVDRVGALLNVSVEAREPALVAVSAPKIELLRSKLGWRAGRVRFADMSEVGRNPARIIPIWQEFVAEHAGSGRPIRGVGEPIWAARSAEELVECARHEALLNVAFAGAPTWRLVCPYDLQSLPPAVIEEACRNHPLIDDGASRTSPSYRGSATISPFDGPLPDPPARSWDLSFTAGRSLEAVRRFVDHQAEAFGLPPSRRHDLVFSANEIATNSLVHADGQGLLRMWPTECSVVCEIRDRGFIEDPLVGRKRPWLENGGGMGLWLANQLCDLVQVRSSPTGSIVRLHVSKL